MPNTWSGHAANTLYLQSLTCEVLYVRNLQQLAFSANCPVACPQALTILCVMPKNCILLCVCCLWHWTKEMSPLHTSKVKDSQAKERKNHIIVKLTLGNDNTKMNASDNMLKVFIKNTRSKNSVLSILKLTVYKNIFKNILHSRGVVPTTADNKH